MIQYCNFFLIGILFVVSCSGDGAEDSIEDFLFIAGITDAQMTSSGITYDITDNGTGLISETDYILFHLRQLDSGNNIIGETFNSDFPIAQAVEGTFTGFKEAVQLIGDGGEITMILPAALTEGLISEGIIIYEINILGVYESKEEYNDSLIVDYLIENDLDSAAMRLDTGVYIIIEEAGEEERPAAGTQVTVNYRGFLLNRVEFDRTFNEPLTISLNGVIPGWQIGIPQFGRGGKGMLFIPSNLAYDEEGQGTIPPNYPIAFEIELVDFDE